MRPYTGAGCYERPLSCRIVTVASGESFRLRMHLSDESFSVLLICARADEAPLRLAIEGVGAELNVVVESAEGLVAGLERRLLNG